jgi:fatty acid CoA ligase FadD9
VHGGTVTFSRGGAHVLEEVQALAPTVIGSVPRLFELLHGRYERRLRAALAAEPEAPRARIEERVLSQIRASFGPHLLAVSVGSAPIGAEVLAFLRRCFADVWVSEGYGSTEVGTIAVDGKIAEGVVVKLVNGEIRVRTPHMISGYLGDRSVVDEDGFFATGDLGEIDAAGRVRVVGRARSTVKLAQGEFVTPERVETVLGALPMVDAIFVHAASGAPGVAAVVVPEREALARALGEDGALEALIARPGATAAVLTALHARDLAPYEAPRAVILATSLERTAAGKLARAALTASYGARLDAMVRGRTAITREPLPVDADMLQRARRALERVTGRAVDPRAPLATGIGVDSLAASEILAALSEDLGRPVPLSLWFESRDLEDLADRLARFAPARGSELRDLAAADRANVLRLDRAEARREVRRVLVTGATGFLGAHVVEALVQRGLSVVCLVRRDLGPALRALEIPDLSVEIVRGDLTSLPDDVLHGVDAVVHAGAVVSWLTSYAALRGPNVLGTLRLLELAAPRGILFHHVSTIGTAPVGGDEQTFLSFEAALASTPYALSKWVAEEKVREAALPGAIYRPAMIAGHTRRGVGNPDDLLQRYMIGCAELGLYIDDEDAMLDMTPVDFVAQAIATVVVGGGGDVYHLANVDRSMSFAALGRALAAAGVETRPAAYPDFRAALARAKSSRLHPLLGFFPERMPLGMGPYPCERTDRALGIERPLIDDALIGRYVRSLRQRGLL